MRDTSDATIDSLVEDIQFLLSPVVTEHEDTKTRLQRIKTFIETITRAARMYAQSVST